MPSLEERAREWLVGHSYDLGDLNWEDKNVAKLTSLLRDVEREAVRKGAEAMAKDFEPFFIDTSADDIVAKVCGEEK